MLRAQDADDSAAARLAGLLQQTSSFSASVRQLLIDQDGREVQETLARLQMQKPASFSWEITEPYHELMVTDGERIWRYEPDLDQVSIQPFDNDLDRTPVMLLSSDAGQIKDSFEVSAVQTDDGGYSSFRLTPRSPDRLFEQLTLTFEGPELLEMHLADSRGQKTSLSFADVVRNQALPPGTFSFTPPDGVEVIDSTGEQP